MRLLTNTDVDGNVTFRSQRLRPYRVPVAHFQATLDAYSKSDSAIIQYDAEAGWAPVPGTTSHDAMYGYDSLGMRVARGGLAPPPARGRPRICLFGDSFMHGDDVPFEATLGHQLEMLLRTSIPTADVINLGVPGYGMDQALLRFRRMAPDLTPDVVVFGFQAENVKRNVNLLRVFYYFRSQLPFSKPRFVLDSEDDRLTLINVPALRPEEIPTVLRRIEEWPLLPFERFYDPDDYSSSSWSWSRTVSVATSLLQPSGGADLDARTFYDPRYEPAALALAILREFADVADQLHSRFLIVHFPKREDLMRLRDGRELAYAELLQDIARQFIVVDSAPQLLEPHVSLDRLFTNPRSGHYTSIANGRIASALAAHLMQELKSR